MKQQKTIQQKNKKSSNTNINQGKVAQSILVHANNLVKDHIESNFEHEVSGKIYSQAYVISQESNKTIGQTFSESFANKTNEKDIDLSVYDKMDELSSLEDEEI